MALSIDILTLGPMCRTKGMTAHVRVSLNFVIRTRIACRLIEIRRERCRVSSVSGRDALT